MDSIGASGALDPGSNPGGSASHHFDILKKRKGRGPPARSGSSSGSVEFGFVVLASRAASSIGKILKCRSRRDVLARIADRGIVHIAAYRADVLPGGRLDHDVPYRNGLRRVGQIDDVVVLEILVPEGGVRRQIDGLVLADELDHALFSLTLSNSNV